MRRGEDRRLESAPIALLPQPPGPFRLGRNHTEQASRWPIFLGRIVAASGRRVFPIAFKRVFYRPRKVSATHSVYESALAVELTLIHVALSLIAMGAGFAAIRGLLVSNPPYRGAALFLATTAATGLTEFFFPFHGFTPAQAVGIAFLILVLIAGLATCRHISQMAGEELSRSPRLSRATSTSSALSFSYSGRRQNFKVSCRKYDGLPDRAKSANAFAIKENACILPQRDPFSLPIVYNAP